MCGSVMQTKSHLSKLLHMQDTHILNTLMTFCYHYNNDSVSNYRHLDYLLNRLFGRWSRKTSKLRVTGLCKRNSPVTGDYSAQRFSNTENVSIWKRQQDNQLRQYLCRHHCQISERLDSFKPIYRDFDISCNMWPLLLTGFNFNPSMENKLHPL